MYMYIYIYSGTDLHLEPFWKNRVGANMIKLEKRDLVLSVDWLGVLSVHLEPGPLFFASIFLFFFSKICSKCKSVAISPFFLQKTNHCC